MEKKREKERERREGAIKWAFPFPSTWMSCELVRLREFESLENGRPHWGSLALA